MSIRLTRIADWRGLWEALRDVFTYWIRRKVPIFRVDNPHTKALPSGSGALKRSIENIRM